MHQRVTSQTIAVVGLGLVGSHLCATLASIGVECHGIDQAPDHASEQLALKPGFTLLQYAFGPTLLSAHPDLGEACSTLVLAARGVAAELPWTELNLREFCEGRVNHIVLISSLAVYGHANSKDPITEATDPVDPSPYGLAKLREEEAVRKVAASLEIRCSHLRTTGLFGRLAAPRPGPRSAAAVDRVLREHLGGAEPTLVLEDGADQYLHAAELAAVVEAVISSDDSPAVMNVGPGTMLQPDDVRSSVEEVVGRPIDLSTVPATGVPVALLDTDLLDSFMPSRAAQRADIRFGLRATLRDLTNDAPSPAGPPDP